MDDFHDGKPKPKRIPNLGFQTHHVQLDLGHLKLNDGTNCEFPNVT